jgi:hypothetical protein
MGPPLALTAHLQARLLDGPQLPFIDRSRLENQLTLQRSHSTPERVPWDPVWLTVLSCQALAQAHQL